VRPGPPLPGATAHPLRAKPRAGPPAPVRVGVPCSWTLSPRASAPLPCARGGGWSAARMACN
jgi:hypothetical protein